MSFKEFLKSEKIMKITYSIKLLLCFFISVFGLSIYGIGIKHDWNSFLIGISLLIGIFGCFYQGWFAREMEQEVK